MSRGGIPGGIYSRVMLPDSPRVIYKRNPLIDVTCQVSFSPILRIDAEPPAAFQEKIRDEYPLLREPPPTGLPPEIPTEVQRVITALGGEMVAKDGKRWEFLPNDKAQVIALTREFLAFTETKYTTWTDFRSRFTALFDVLNEVYHPGSFVRLDLRYRNLVRRSAIECEEVPWHQLIASPIAGPLEIAERAGRRVAETKGEMVLDAKGEAVAVRLLHGLIDATNNATGLTERSYLIDSDFYVEGKTDVGDVPSFLDRANTDARRLFRWCITDRLHHAFVPRDP